MIKVISIIAFAVCLGYILYINGFLVVNSKTALLYMGSPRLGKRQNCITAKFSSCNGVIKRVICLRDAKRYQFVLSSNMTKGAVSVELRGTGKEVVAILDHNNPCAVISTDKSKRYRVATRFVKADGEYTLSWNEM